MAKSLGAIPCGHGGAGLPGRFFLGRQSMPLRFGMGPSAIGPKGKALKFIEGARKPELYDLPSDPNETPEPLRAMGSEQKCREAA